MVIFVLRTFLWLNDIFPHLLWPLAEGGQEIESVVGGGQIEKAVCAFVGRNEKRGEKKEYVCVTAFELVAPGWGDLWLCVF